MKPLGPDEEWARCIIASALDTEVVQHDDGTQPGMYDLDIMRDGEPVGAVEVIAARDPKATELWNIANGTEEHWQVPELKGGWVVDLAPDDQDEHIKSARFNRLSTELPPFLRLLEDQGRQDLDCTSSDPTDPLVQQGGDLGIVHAFQGTTTSYEGSIYLTIDEFPMQQAEQLAGSADTFLRWISKFLSDDARQDVLKKLQRSGSLERHAYIAVPPFSVAPEGVLGILMSRQQPTGLAAPELPFAVTHVWVVPTWNGPGLQWSPKGGWQIVQRERSQDACRP